MVIRVVFARRCRVLAGAILAGVLPSAPAVAACDDWNPAGSPAPSSALGPVDLIEIAGIGRADVEPNGGASPIDMSPDGRWATFVLQRADVEENRYCQALMVIDLAGRASPRVLDRGGDYISDAVTMRGISIHTGYPQQILPRWAPDGKTIAFLKREQGTTQLWARPVNGGAARQLTREPIDVLAWAWMAEGRIGFAIEPDRLRINETIEAEGRTGWIYDERVTPNIGFRPQLPAPLPRHFKTIDLAGGEAIAASPAEVEMLRAEFEARAGLRADGTGAARAWTDHTAASPLSPRRIHLVDTSGKSHRCAAPACSGKFAGLWWDDETLVFLKREGWNNRFTALYRWLPDAGSPERMLQTDDVIERCVQAGPRLVCIRETAMRPAHIVALDTRSGQLDVLFDPNPGFARRVNAKVERLTWRNEQGLEVYGDLVLPADYRMGERLPTIVTLYQSRGFLRGGTGNEYPIYLFAQRGYAVLSIDHPALFAARFPELETNAAIYAANIHDWSERRSTHSAIMAGVDLLIDRGIADPNRIGITGLSAGASATRFAIINSDRFAAASVSSCCVDETSAVLVGPAWEAYSRSVGFPAAFPLDEAFWRPASLVLNATSISTPLLMQLADREALYGLPSFVAMRQYGQPVELRIFPDEYHIKWQPRHRQAIYRTNLDWFDFWLKGVIDPSVAKAEQYARWKILKENARPARRSSKLP